MNQPHIAPFTAFRIAALPGNALDLAQTLTPALLEDVCVRRRRADTLSRNIENAIHHVVPSVPDDDRRALLALRRDLHNRRPPRAAGLHAAAEHGVDVETLLRWRTEEQDALRTVESLAEADSCSAERRVRDLLGHDDVDNALRLLSPGFHAALSKPAPAGSGRGRSAMAFTARAALKPSPLSTLTRTAVTGADLTGRSSSLSPLVAFRVLETVAARRDAVRGLRYRSTVSAFGEQLVASPETSAMVDGTVVFARRSVQLHGDDTEARLLSAWGGGDADALSSVAGGWIRAQRWLSVGAVQVAPPWSGTVRAPEEVLGELMVGGASPDIVAAGRLLIEVGRRAAAVAHTSGASRSALVAAVGTDLRRLATALELELPEGRLVNEDGGTRPLASRAVTEGELSILSEQLRPTMFRSRVYDLLLSELVATSGRGGTVIDVMGFLTTCWTSRPFRQALQAAREADRRPDAHLGRQTLAVGITSAPPTLSVFLQRTTGDEDAAIVVNQLMPGLGAVVARLGDLGDGRETLLPTVSSWIDELYPGVADHAAVLPGRDVNPLQRAAAAALPSLPGDDLGEAFAGLSLTHDPARDVLEFERADGRPLALVPLGIVPAWTFDGPVGLLLALLDPWVDGSQITREANPLHRARRAHTAERIPRLATGTVVMRRATWRIPIELVPARGTTSPGEFLVALHEWRTAVGMPDEVFVRVHGDDAFDAATRKPMWLRFSSWYAVSAVWALLPGRHTLEVQECLPPRSATEHATESVITLRWPRDERTLATTSRQYEEVLTP
ncbi:hypothetical protein [Curtobacterium sp. MCBD17_019]|uniref:hypothetical protein n=1 Tax=Curtobacterium sp. MCBD17_019 TaxID=2175669 RepID=UPI000DAA1B16|nr:hypothetical protein [Curtobacterium sp. MCBD17_019]PZE78427.1 hypothetical protein DEI82_01275 [Curtobacterium sp. MCBD17_019]